MGLGKLTRDLGKVGALLEVVGYVIAGGKRLVRAVKGDPAARWDTDLPQDRGGDDPDQPDTALERIDIYRSQIMAAARCMKPVKWMVRRSYRVAKRR